MSAQHPENLWLWECVNGGWVTAAKLEAVEMGPELDGDNIWGFTQIRGIRQSLVP